MSYAADGTLITKHAAYHFYGVTSLFRLQHGLVLFSVFLLNFLFYLSSLIPSQQNCLYESGMVQAGLFCCRIDVLMTTASEETLAGSVPLICLGHWSRLDFLGIDLNYIRLSLVRYRYRVRG